MNSVADEIHIIDITRPRTTNNLLRDFVYPNKVAPHDHNIVQVDGTIGKVPASQPMRSLPTELLYDSEGLELFSEITGLDGEYYLTGCEISILRDQIDDIIECIPWNATIVELGCGSMAKTSILLDGLRAADKGHCSFYALDIDEHSLRMSLQSLYNHDRQHEEEASTIIDYFGIYGTYEEAAKSFLKEIPGCKVILWLGSSLGNVTRQEAAAFIRRFQENAMNPGDMFLIGADKRNDPGMIALAYNDTKGVTAAFGMNGLNHLNRLLGQQILDTSNFEYFAGYNVEEGRHEAYFRSTAEQAIKIPNSMLEIDGDGFVSVNLKQGELVSYECSYKYSLEEAHELADTAGLTVSRAWTDTSQRYGFYSFEKPLVHFHRNPDGRIERQLPTRQAWEEVWKLWDTLTSEDMVVDYSDHPIELRHPYIFYVGHIPAFCDILLSRCLDQPFTPPDLYPKIFERGIDPVVENPDECHPHSEVPDKWPPIEEILAYKAKVRQRLFDLYDDHEANPEKFQLRRLARTLHMALEHEIMHSETLLYMMIQSPVVRPPPGIQYPFQLQRSSTELQPAQWLRVEAGDVVIGFDDSEDADFKSNELPEMFGWDNEWPRRIKPVNEFYIQHRPVSIGEYLRFLKANYSEDLVPSSWAIDGDNYSTKTVFGLVPLENVLDWPVPLSFNQASAFLDYLKVELQDDSLRIPTEEELTRFYQTHEPRFPNVGFAHWHPVRLTDTETHVFGSLWEWTSSDFDNYDGFVQSVLYPGYSKDFFDGLHNVVLGGSWATHPRLVGRMRNFFQRSYPYAFNGVRFCRN